MSEAEGHLRHVLSRRFDFAAAHLNLGVVLVNRGQEEGRKEFLEALRVEPRLTRAYDNLGLLVLKDGQFSTTAELFKHAIANCRAWGGALGRFCRSSSDCFSGASVWWR